MSHLRPIVTGSLLVLAASLSAAPAQETSSVNAAARPHHVYLIGQLRIMQPWIDAVESSADRADAYMVVENRGNASERLVGARTDAADHVAIASTGDDDGATTAGVTIPPRSTVTLQPDQTHLVLEGLHGDVRARESVPGVLTFERAGPLHVQFATTRGAALHEDQTDPATDDPAQLFK